MFSCRSTWYVAFKETLTHAHTHTHTCAGTTVTVALSIGWLLTVANAGDSGCVLDTGSSMLDMISSHRIHTSTREQARLKEARQYVASLGFHLQVRKRTQGGVGWGSWGLGSKEARQYVASLGFHLQVRERSLGGVGWGS